MDTKPLFPVRSNSPVPLGTGVDGRPGLNSRGELLVAAGLPSRAQIVAGKNSWRANTATAAAPVTAIPTTASLIQLWNGDPKKVYVIDSAYVLVVAATAAVQAHGILLNIGSAPVVAAIANTITPVPLYANAVYGGQARVAVGTTLDAVNGVAANWVPVGAIPGINTTQVGSACSVDLDGRFQVPFQGQVALTIISGAATATSVQVGLSWHEVDA